MAGLQLTINEMGNAAFEDRPECEVAFILRAVADRIERGVTKDYCWDTNGNSVGYFTLTLPEGTES
jgi:hypothetical protein